MMKIVFFSKKLFKTFFEIYAQKFTSGVVQFLNGPFMTTPFLASPIKSSVHIHESRLKIQVESLFKWKIKIINIYRYKNVYVCMYIYCMIIINFTEILHQKKFFISKIIVKYLLLVEFLIIFRQNFFYIFLIFYSHPLKDSELLSFEIN